MGSAIVCGEEGGAPARLVAHELAGRLGARVVVADAPSADAMVAAAERERAAFLVVGATGHGAFVSALRGEAAGELTRHAPCPVVVVPPGLEAPHARLAGGLGVIAGVLEDEPHVPEVAGLLGELLEVPVTLAHAIGFDDVVAAPAAAGSVPIVVDELRDAHERRAHEVLDAARQRCGRTADAVALVVREGPAAPALRELAERRDAAALVVGSRGRGAVAAGILGSTSRELARDAPCPVVVCPRAS